MSVNNRNIKLSTLNLFSYIVTVIYAWSYGNSYIVYATGSILLMLFVYYKLFQYRSCSFRIIRLWLIFILVLSTLIGTIKGNLQSPLMVNCSLLLPVVLSSIDINYKNLSKQVMICSICCLPVMMIISRQAESWNSNSLAFMMYCGISIGFLWFEFSKSKISRIGSLLYLLYGTTYLFATGSRNASMVIVLCAFILMLPVYYWKNKFFYRLSYLIPVFATIFAIPIMQFVFSSNQVLGVLTDFTSQYSSKAWGMDTHLDILLHARDVFYDNDLITQLFGEGMKTRHRHNIFYQCLFFYGIFGVFVVYTFYIWIFEKAYYMIKTYNDTLVIGCVVILIGHFLMQVGEVYMLGSESANIISLIPASIILQRYNKCYK